VTPPRPSRNRTARPATEAPFELPGRFRAVVFDLDGVLVDSEEAWFQAERAMMRRHDVVLNDEDRRASLGRSPEQSIAVYAARLGWSGDRRVALRAELVSLMSEAYRSIKPMPGARDVVHRLHGVVPLGLASNTDRSLVESALDATSLTGCFDAIVCADEVDRPKPDPDLYLRACELLGVVPEDAVAFEDSETGVAAAKGAGLTCVAVPLYEGVDVSRADAVLRSLATVVVG
jgi:HAD superfamily hydrolase (TIGR01509 family)